MSAPRSSEDSLGARVRAALAAEHRATERSELARRIVRGDMTPRLHGLKLRAYAGLHEQLDRSLQGSPSTTVRDVLRPEQLRSATVHRDLEDLGVLAAPTAALDCAVAEVQAQIVATEGRAPRLLGWLYVMDGSRLGARVVAPRLRAALPGVTAFRYYEADSELAPGQFTAFKDRLASVLGPDEEVELIAGGRDAFAGVARLFEAVVISDGMATDAHAAA